jgi:hypothetical protein
VTKGVPLSYITVWGAGAPATQPGDNDHVVVANRVETAVDGYVIGLRYFRALIDASCHLGMLQNDAADNIIDSLVFYRRSGVASPDGEWQSRYFRTQHRFLAGDRFVVAVHFQDGQYWRDSGALGSGPQVNGDLRFTQDGDGGSNGLYSYVRLLPDNTFGSTAYGVDVIFRSDAQ